MVRSAKKTAQLSGIQTKGSAEPMRPIPLPKPVKAKEGMATLPNGKRLYYWDTGGRGDAVVLMHPASGSALIWGYQQPAFARAGYRVIGYSRRGYLNSDPVSAADPGVAADDLHCLADLLRLKRFHIVACAAGGVGASEYASVHPERVISLTVASNPCGVRGGYLWDMWSGVWPENWRDLPRWFWEIGPSYRMANPEGLKMWQQLEDRSSEGKAHAVPQLNGLIVTEETLEVRRIPTLLMTGDADLATPPYIIRAVAKHLRSCKVVIVPEAGHSLYWERPDVFNANVLALLDKHREKGRKI